MMEFGKRLAAAVRPGAVIALKGDLGAGKTTLTRGLADGLDIEENVASPTYTLIREYDGRLPLYHMDAYRLRNVDDFLALGAEEYLFGSGVTVIEWSERVAEALPADAAAISLEVLADGGRRLCLQSPELEPRLP